MFYLHGCIFQCCVAWYHGFIPLILFVSHVWWNSIEGFTIVAVSELTQSLPSSNSTIPASHKVLCPDRHVRTLQLHKLLWQLKGQTKRGDMLRSRTGSRWLMVEGKYLVVNSSPVYNVNIVVQWCSSCNNMLHCFAIAFFASENKTK